MITCPSCSKQAPEGSNFCPSCGAQFFSVLEESPTLIASPAKGEPKSPGRSTRFRTSQAGVSQGGFSESRFLPGVLLAGRYRIVSLLGKGGMGEVYRAEDLKLGQPVALKFLPEDLQQDEEHMNRLLGEVKLARQVSHPNVCRVYDVGEVDGQHFLTMEYVDGEDLSSLLRRIGRLPRDKAVVIAREISAGLAAAHDQGILHRDLKPANIMIDSRGRARITDFGLANLAEGIAGRDERAGTPGYMSPEQIAGKEVTMRSDIYSLGLVLYELFTGKKPFKAATALEQEHLQQESTPPSPSSFVEGFDPVVERIILRCLERDPMNRPASALAVAAALPGGDPLAAALAAGETPSPEMVAAAGGEGALKAAISVPILIFTLAALILIAFLFGKYSLFGYVPLKKPPEVLAERAREAIAAAGYSDPYEDSSYGFITQYQEYIDYIQKKDHSLNRWDRLSAARPTAISFWYRQSPRQMSALNPQGRVFFNDPPLDLSGMRNVILDSQGKLAKFISVPPQFDESDGNAQAVDWSVLFREAGLNMGDFKEAKSRWVPEIYSDTRIAWEGTYADQKDPAIRVEAASYKGRPVYFEIIHPFDRPARMQPVPQTAGQRAQNIINGVLVAALIVGAFFLARYNMNHGRGDRKGAFRISIYYFSFAMIAFFLMLNHVTEINQEIYNIIKGVGVLLFMAGLIWLMYVALEPFIRRQWPGSLVSWNRLLAGRFRDPLVGRHLLFGAAAGALMGLLFLLADIVPGLLGSEPVSPEVVNADYLRGAIGMFGRLFYSLSNIILAPMLHIFLIMLLKVILRKWWIAIPAYVIFMTVFFALTSSYILISLPFVISAFSLIVFLMLRFGFVSAIISFFFANLFYYFPLTLDFSAWYAYGSVIGLVLACALTAYAFFISLERQSPAHLESNLP